MTEKSIERAELLQKEMHWFIDSCIKENNKLTYDTCQIVFFLNKIAEIQEGLIELFELSKIN